MRTELKVPGEFSSQAQLEAEQAAASSHDVVNDRTDIDFITVDPPGSKDLDQALHIATAGDGYLVSYAITDMATFVAHGSALDLETRERGETYYFPDARVGLHPAVLSEGAASLLPGRDRPTVLWQIRLDGQGNPISADVQRATVRSRQQWDYRGLQAAADSGSAPEAARLLGTVGSLRQQLARQRHSISLDLPEQEVVRQDGQWTVRYRAPLPLEDANAEISLLTGVCAARLMLDGGIGVLRTLPPADPAALHGLRAIAPALRVSWPEGAQAGDVLASLEPSNPKHAAFIDHAAALLRGAGYTTFDGVPPEQPHHAGIGLPYAHVTAPLRRLVDRFGTEICLALKAKDPVPDWVTEALGSLPNRMQSADRLAHTADRAVIDATEAFLLQDRIGEQFDAIVLASDDRTNGSHGSHRGATIAIEQPAIRARCQGTDLTVGDRVKVTLQVADVATRSASFGKG